MVLSEGYLWRTRPWHLGLEWNILDYVFCDGNTEMTHLRSRLRSHKDKSCGSNFKEKLSKASCRFGSLIIKRKRKKKKKRLDLENCNALKYSVFIVYNELRVGFLDFLHPNSLSSWDYHKSNLVLVIQAVVVLGMQQSIYLLFFHAHWTKKAFGFTPDVWSAAGLHLLPTWVKEHPEEGLRRGVK